jgi:hypothetical protein
MCEVRRIEMDYVSDYIRRLKGMRVLVDGQIKTRHVYLTSEHEGLICINRGYRKVVKSADPFQYQYVATDEQVGDEVTLPGLQDFAMFKFEE